MRDSIFATIFNMDELFRNRYRAFLAQPTEENLGLLAQTSTRSGHNIDFTHGMTRNQLVDTANGSPETFSTLVRITAFYRYLKGELHPWKNCEGYYVARSPSKAIPENLACDDLVYEFFYWLRVLEPKAPRAYSKLFTAHLAEMAVMGDRGGWELHAPTVMIDMVRRLKASVYVYSLDIDPAWMQRVGAYRAFEEGFNTQPSAWENRYSKLLEGIETGQMEQIYGVMEAVNAAIDYFNMNTPSPFTLRPGAPNPIVDAISEIGLFNDNCIDAVENIEDWINRQLMPKFIADAAASLRASIS